MPCVQEWPADAVDPRGTCREYDPQSCEAQCNAMKTNLVANRVRSDSADAGYASYSYVTSLLDDNAEEDLVRDFGPNDKQNYSLACPDNGCNTSFDAPWFPQFGEACCQEECGPIFDSSACYDADVDCTADTPCAVGEGGCDEDADCTDDLVCIRSADGVLQGGGTTACCGPRVQTDRWLSRATIDKCGICQRESRCFTSDGSISTGCGRFCGHGTVHGWSEGSARPPHGTCTMQACTATGVDITT